MPPWREYLTGCARDGDGTRPPGTDPPRGDAGWSIAFQTVDP